MTRIALVPGCLALLPEHSSLEDPVADLRAACQAALEWLGPDVRLIATDQGARVGRALLAARRRHDASQEPGVLVVANGSACRSISAPGYLDERAEPFDARLGQALAEPDAHALEATDHQLAGELWAATSVLPELARELRGGATVSIDYDDAPYGVQYWVMRWQR